MAEESNSTESNSGEAEPALVRQALAKGKHVVSVPGWDRHRQPAAA